MTRKFEIKMVIKRELGANSKKKKELDRGSSGVLTGMHNGED